MLLAELQAYADCVDNHPTSWNVKCAELKGELNACAKTQCAAVSPEPASDVLYAPGVADTLVRMFADQLRDGQPPEAEV